MRLFRRGKSYLRGEKEDLSNIKNRILKRDFSGNTGQAVKNSAYQFSTNLVSKIGALIFTIIIARLLMPELFGLYSLALGTIGIFAGFSDLGFGQALIRFISRELTKNKPNTKGYYQYILKIRLVLTFSASLLLISLAYPLANNYYHKPIFYALLAGGLYLAINSLVGFFSGVYQARNNFKKIFLKEIIFQILRLTILPLAILYFLRFSNELILLIIVLTLSFCYFLILLFLLWKKPEMEGNRLSNLEKKKVNKFTFPLSVTVLSGLFFGYIDMFMLGYFVKSEFIGYYSASFAIVGSAIAVLGFSSALFPIFSRLNGKKLEFAIKKSLHSLALISIIIILFTIIFAPFIIKIIYGQGYTNSIILLRLSSPLIFSGPIIAIYVSYFTSKGKTRKIAKFLVSTTLINIFLNFIFISYLIRYSGYLATIGAVLATLFSKYFYLGIFWISWKREK